MDRNATGDEGKHDTSYSKEVTPSPDLSLSSPSSSSWNRSAEAELERIKSELCEIEEVLYGKKERLTEGNGNESTHDTHTTPSTINSRLAFSPHHFDSSYTAVTSPSRYRPQHSHRDHCNEHTLPAFPNTPCHPAQQPHSTHVYDDLRKFLSSSDRQLIAAYQLELANDSSPIVSDRSDSARSNKQVADGVADGDGHADQNAAVTGEEHSSMNSPLRRPLSSIPTAQFDISNKSSFNPVRSESTGSSPLVSIDIHSTDANTTPVSVSDANNVLSPSGSISLPPILPPSVPGYVSSTSLSDLLKMSDLSYPTSAPSSSDIEHRKTLTPVNRTNYFTNSRDQSQPNSVGSKTKELAEADRIDNSIHRLHRYMSRDLESSSSLPADSSLSSSSLSRLPLPSAARRALDPTSRLLESLWAAEAEFDRIIEEELPDLTKERRRRRADDTALSEEINNNRSRNTASLVSSNTETYPLPSTVWMEADNHPSISCGQRANHFDESNRLHQQNHVIIADAELNSDSNTYLAIANWDGLKSMRLPASPAHGLDYVPSSARDQSVLFTTSDYVPPDDLMDQLISDETFGQKISKFHEARGIGHLVEVNQWSKAIKEYEHKLRESNIVGESSGRSLRSNSTTVSSLSQSSNLPSIGVSSYPSLSPRHPSDPPRASHLHRTQAHPIDLLKHVEFRRLESVLGGMDEDLEKLELQAKSLSAEYQADQRALYEYQQRLEKRKQVRIIDERIGRKIYTAYFMTDR